MGLDLEFMVGVARQLPSHPLKIILQAQMYVSIKFPHLKQKKSKFDEC